MAKIQLNKHTKSELCVTLDTVCHSSLEGGTSHVYCLQQYCTEYWQSVTVPQNSQANL